jgi:[ribosomal protein S5]-alanine N-acetyltransferase
MSTSVQPTIRTERLILRPFELSDAKTVQLLAGDRAVADTTLLIPHPYHDGAAEAWIGTHDHLYAEGTQATFAITLLEGGTLIGAIALTLSPPHARGELGYWIAVLHWGRGYATEAGRAVVRFGFDILKLHRIQARHLTRNPASGRVLQKLGMRVEGVQREAIQKWGVFEDLALYAILSTDEP